MPAEGNAHERHKLEPDALVSVEIEIIGYIADDGKLRMAYRINGDSQMSTVLGLMEQCRFSLLKEWDEQAEIIRDQDPPDE